MDTGSYYSLQGSGHAIWSSIVEGRTVQAIGENFLEDTVDGKPVKAHLDEFLRSLTAEELITPATSAGNSGNGSSSSEKVAFLVPALEKFTDMEEFLLVDPIHEVGEQGWPQRQEDPPQ